MSGKAPWDITSPRSLEAFAEWIRSKANASVVFVVRGEGCALAIAPGIGVERAREAIEFALPGAVEVLAARRKEEREAAVRRRAAKISGQAQETSK